METSHTGSILNRSETAENGKNHMKNNDKYDLEFPQTSKPWRVAWSYWRGQIYTLFIIVLEMIGIMSPLDQHTPLPPLGWPGGVTRVPPRGPWVVGG